MADNFRKIKLDNGWELRVWTEKNPVLGWQWLIIDPNKGMQTAKAFGYEKSQADAERVGRSRGGQLPPLSKPESQDSHDTQESSDNQSATDKVKDGVENFVNRVNTNRTETDNAIINAGSYQPTMHTATPEQQRGVANTSGKTATRQVPGLQAESQKMGQIAESNAIARAWDAANRYRQNAGVSTDRTPEMLRSEHYARLADRLNNEGFWAPGAYFTKAGQAPQEVVKDGVYQMPKIEIEDQRQQQINRQRWGDKLNYQELTVPQNADQLAQRLDEMGMKGSYDLDKLRAMQPQVLAQMARVNSVAIDNALASLDPAAMEIITRASANNQAQINKYGLWLANRSGDPFKDIMMAAGLGLHAPSIMDLLGYIGGENMGNFMKLLFGMFGGNEKSGDEKK